MPAGQVSGKLFAEELTVGHVRVEGLQHVVAIRPNAHELIAVEADAVGVADCIKPEHRLPLGETRAGEQSINDLLVRVIGRIGNESVDLFQRPLLAPTILHPLVVTHGHAASVGQHVG
jgi:hypothetical protein